MTNTEKGAFLKLFNRSGAVLDIPVADFDAITMDSVGVALCHKYGVSRGKSLREFITEAGDDDAYIMNALKSMMNCT